MDDEMRKPPVSVLPPTVESFSNVDSTGDPDQLVRYLDQVAERLRERKRDGYALLGLRPGDAVLDVGCGPGHDVFELEAIVGPTGRAAGVDMSSVMIEEAKKRAATKASRAEFSVSPVGCVAQECGSPESAVGVGRKHSLNRWWTLLSPPAETARPNTS